MKPVSNETILKQLHWRYATKKFDPTKRISAEDWSTLEQSLVLTPSSYGLQPWKFVVVSNPEIRSKLVPVSWGQKQVVDASHIVVFTVPQQLQEAGIDKLVQRTAEVRGVEPGALAGYRQMMVGNLLNGQVNLKNWAALQAYIALGQFMATAAMMGIDTCPMEGIEPDKYDDILGLRDKGYATAVVCVAGYRSGDDKYANLAKVRYVADDVIEHL